MPLHQLFTGIGLSRPAINPLITGLALDHRQIKPGDAFIALSGTQTHGLQYAERALLAGASVVLFEPPAPAQTKSLQNLVEVPALRAHLGRLANYFYGEPSSYMRLVGVTGTNGKTSTVQLLAQALNSQKLAVATIGTLGSGMYGDITASDRTTPDVLSLHRLLAELKSQSAKYVAMEVSSHALDQGRVSGVQIDVGVFTNLTHDHLDYHGTMEAYARAKSRLFELPSVRVAVLNLDDSHGMRIKESLPKDMLVVGFSTLENPAARLRANDIRLTSAGLEFELHDVLAARRASVRSCLLGRFNVENILAVASVLLAEGFEIEQIVRSIAGLTPVPGRMNTVRAGSGKPLVVVDYAHTPDALEQTLASLRGHVKGRLICVFGCGGDRDRGKRPLMARVAQMRADQIVVTDDNPRSESNGSIVAQICLGFDAGISYHIEHDRRKAIEFAIQGAGPDDVVLIAGKGHEAYQEVKGERLEFSDRQVAAELLGGAS